MKTEDATADRPTRMWCATASLVLCVLGWAILVMASSNPAVSPSGAFGLAFFAWAVSLGAGIVALVVIRVRRPAFKGKLQAVLGVCVSGGAIVWFGASFVVVSLALRGEAFDESNPPSVIAKIENTCGFKFPEKVESLKAADRISGGVPPCAYQFIVRFTTGQNGFVQLRDSLSEIDDGPQGKGHYGGLSDPRYFRRSREVPKWYEGEIEGAVIYESVFLTTGTIWLQLHTVCAELEQAEKVEVYMEGWGDTSLKEDKDSFR